MDAAALHIRDARMEEVLLPGVAGSNNGLGIGVLEAVGAGVAKLAAGAELQICCKMPLGCEDLQDLGELAAQVKKPSASHEAQWCKVRRARWPPARPVK